MSGNTAQGFLDDIIAHPDDDTPRLIFADWLEDHGASARAEFIRVQIERAILPEWDARQVRLRPREKALLEDHGKTWKAELPSIKGITWEAFRRGFVTTATFANFALLGTQASDCWAAAPIEAVSVRWPRQDDSSESIAPVAGLRELSILGKLVDVRDVGRLGNAPLLSTLRALNLRDCGLGQEAFRRLINSPFLENLTALRAPYNSLGNGSINALVSAASLASLEKLDLAEKGSYGRYGEDPIIDASGLGLLARWPGLAQIRSLILSGNEAQRDGLRALLRSPHIIGLKRLALRGNSLNGSALAEFIQASPGLQLDVLDLGENVLRDLGADNLTKATCLRELKVLKLDRCELRLPAMRKLAAASFLTTVRRLNVNHNSFGPQGLQALLDAKPGQLHTLDLFDVDLGDAGAARLAEAPTSDTLLELNLGNNVLGDRAAAALAESQYLRNLLVLQLHDNRISKPGAETLKQSPLGKRLAVLELPRSVRDDNIPF